MRRLTVSLVLSALVAATSHAAAPADVLARQQALLQSLRLPYLAEAEVIPFCVSGRGSPTDSKISLRSVPG